MTKAWMQVTLPDGRNFKGYAEIFQEGEIGSENSGWKMNLEIFDGIFKYDQERHKGVVHEYSPFTEGFINLASERNREKALIARLQRRGRPVSRLVKSMRKADKNMDDLLDVMGPKTKK